MAMLAEPRRRKRYNLTPRGNALYNDESRLGTKLLQKMGWSKGKGLGANEDGDQEFLKVSYKNDVEGLGYNVRDDQWTEHEQSFNDFLNQLNGNNKTDNCDLNDNNTDEESSMRPMGFGFKMNESEEEVVKKKKLKGKISGMSLEEKSKQSKARVHYKKFTRGKDLSQYSEKDLANIFGKKETHADEPKSSNIDKLEEPESEDKISNFAGVQTISSTVSVADYFKQKMEAIKNKNKSAQTLGNEPQPISTTSQKELKEESKDSKNNYSLWTEPQIDFENCYHEAETFVKKKKNKNKKDQKESSALPSNEETCVSETVKLKKKKKNKDKEEKQEELVTIEPSTIQDNQIVESKKKKKKKRAEHNAPEIIHKVTKNKSRDELMGKAQQEELLTVELSTIQDNKLVDKSKKKKKKRARFDAPEIILNEEPTENDEVSERKRKQGKELIGEEKLEVLTAVEPSIMDKSKKKKKKKVKPGDPEVRDNNSAMIEESEGTTVIHKKKEKKRELKEELELSTESISKRKRVDAADVIKEPQSCDVSVAPPQVNAVVDSRCSGNESDDSTNSARSQIIPFQQLIEKQDSYNVYTISSFCAERFHLFDMNAYGNSTLAHITGYGYDETIKVEVIETKNDAQRILDLWSGKNDKYSKPKINTPDSVRSSTLKSLKRRSAFTGL